MDTEKKRSANFTTREKDILISLVKKYFKIIENKKTNAVFNKQKQECWEKLAWEYNANQTSGLRTGSQLKSLYEQMKKLAKQHKADEKIEVLKTGGGSFESKISGHDEKVLSLLEETYFSINNIFDSNATQSIPGPSGIQHNSTISDNNISSGPYLHDNLENIVVIYEEPLPEPNVLPESNEDISLQSQDTEGEPPRKKKKFLGTRRPSMNGNIHKERIFKKSTIPSITKKRLELCEKKLNILNVIEETEMENLRGKKMDNEIKKIIKERELIELEIKKRQLANLNS